MAFDIESLRQKCDFGITKIQITFDNGHTIPEVYRGIRLMQDGNSYLVGEESDYNSLYLKNVIIEL